MTKTFKSLAGRRRPNYGAEQQLCPSRKVKKFVVRSLNRFFAFRH
jgi:hypothetical protein